VSIAVKCSSVTKDYYSAGTITPALKGIDLEINKGELFMFVGPSGCGKTTLISVIAGILTHDKGEVEVLGTNLKNISDKERTKFRGKNLGFVFQSYNLIPTLTVWENVSVPLRLNGVEGAQLKERSIEVIAQVGLKGKENFRPTQLSGGQQQRVAIARALIHKPSVIVCDEPTSALDKETGQKVMELFRSVALENGRTLIIVTHDNRIFPYADRVATMNDGLVEKIQSNKKNFTD
jgi:putative ABC transport system ATP-binding protein